MADPGRRARCRTSRPRSRPSRRDGAFLPYARDPETLARPWAIPGTPGLEHRIGGLEKADGTGNVSYDPDNHDLMTRLRAQKVAGIAADIPELEVDDPDGARRLLVLGWGGTYGPIAAARAARPRARAARSRTRTCATSTRSRATPATCCGATTACSIPEMNLGQLLKLVRAEFLVDAARLQPRARRCRSARASSSEAIEAVIES